MKDYPEIKPPFVQGILKPGQKFYPFQRDPETLVRRWALPGRRVSSTESAVWRRPMRACCPTTP